MVNPSATSAYGVNRSASGIAKVWILPTLQDRRESDLQTKRRQQFAAFVELEGGDVPGCAYGGGAYNFFCTSLDTS